MYKLKENKELLIKIIAGKAKEFRSQYQEYVDGCMQEDAERLNCEEMASYAWLETTLYEVLSDREAGLRAAKALCDMGRMSFLFDERSKKEPAPGEGGRLTILKAVLTSGRPLNAPMDSMFRPTYYMLSYLRLKQDGFFTPEDQELCRRAALLSITPLTAYTDWGPQNRGMIKGLNLMLAAKCFPEDEMADHRLKLGKILCGESIGKWSIEDAQIYIPIWLNQLILYHEQFGSLTWYSEPSVYYYFRYMVSLMAPGGIVPDFGDGRWMNSQEAYIACLEKGGAVYQNGEMRYAAAKLAEAVSSEYEKGRLDINNACFLASAAKWADPKNAPAPFEMNSAEVPDELIGKKYRLARDGEDGRFLLFNYRDEGGYAWLPRHYMRNTIVADNEKTHHGHCDENSIVFMTAGNSILLHDAGYREMKEIDASCLPGTYRSDFYHNKMLVRKGIPAPETNFIDFCSQEEIYNKVRSEKIYFEKFPDCDAARTRVYDQKHSVICDRTVIFLKEEGCYVLLDTVTAQEDGDYTAGPVFYAEHVEQAGHAARMKHTKYADLDAACDRDDGAECGCYDLKIDAIYRDQPFENVYPNGDDYTLRILFPESDYEIGTKTLRRNYTQETGLFQYTSKHLKAGETVSVFTVLYPHKPAESLSEVTARVIPSGANGNALLLATPEGEHLFACKTDIDRGIKKELRRPAYDFRKTSVGYGPLMTDAVFTHVFDSGKQKERKRYETIYFTALEYRGNKVFEVPPSSLIQGDFSLDNGIAAWNKWYGEIGEEEKKLEKKNERNDEKKEEKYHDNI